MGRPMTGLVLGGAVLFLIGLGGLAMPIFTTERTRDVARIGDVKLQATESTAYAIPPIVSGGALALGVLLIGTGLYRRV